MIPFSVSASVPTVASAPVFAPQPQVPELEYDLAIAGGGIAGATLAAALKASGLRIALIEAQPQSEAVAKGQAYALHLSSRQIFQAIGVWEAIAPRIEAFTRVRLSDADFPGMVWFQPQDLQTDAIGYVAEHGVLLQALQEFLRHCPHVTWFCPARVTHTVTEADGVEVQLAPVDPAVAVPARIRAKLLVAADGSRSQIRQQAGITTHGWPYWQSCIVATIAPEKPHHQTAYERFWPGGPFAILPLPHNRCRIVWTVPRTEVETLMALDRDQFIQELSRRYGDQMGPLTLVGQPFVFPAQLMHTRRYVLPRLALVGDAAHCCHPVGGQGLNMGLRDVAALAEVIQTAHQRGQDIGDLKLLRTYERWRQRENWATLAFTDFLDRLFSNRWLPLVGVRRLGLLLMQSLHPLRIFALKFMAGLSFRSAAIARSGDLP